MTAPQTPPVHPLVAAVRALGSDAEDVRDAAHEAHHALEAGVPRGQWTRANIDRHVRRMTGRIASSEVRARAVEQLVCQRLGVPVESVESFAALSSFEATRRGLPFPDVEGAAVAIARIMASDAGQAAADRVLAILESAGRRRAPSAPRRATMPKPPTVVAPEPTQAATPPSPPVASATTCRARWEGGACAGVVVGLGLCDSHNRRRLRAEAAGRSRAEVEAAINRPLKPRGKEPRKLVTVHVSGAVHRVLSERAERDGTTVTGMLTRAAERLAEDE